MTNHEDMQKPFSVLHASPDTLEKVYQKMGVRKKRRHIIPKGLLVAAVLALSLTVAGAAGVVSLVDARVSREGDVSDSTLHAFSSGSIETDGMEMYDNQNNPIDLPTMERVLTDKDMIQQLVGDALCRVEATLETDGYTITLENLLMDENGAGILTYTLSNPNGINYAENGYGEVTTPLLPSLKVGSAMDTLYMDSKVCLDKSESTDTCLHLVMYFANFGEWHHGDDLYFTVNSGVDGSQCHAIRITPQSYVPEVTLVDNDGGFVRLSALSIYCDNPYPDRQQHIDELIVDFGDGCFVLESNYLNITNWVVGCVVNYDEDGNRAPDGTDIGLAYVFNRLVDTSQVRYVQVWGYYIDDLGQCAEYTNTYWSGNVEMPVS